MAYCGVITWYNADGKPLGCIRYGEMPTDEAGALIEDRMRDDLGWILSERPDLKLITLADRAIARSGAMSAELTVGGAFLWRERRALVRASRA